MHNADVDSLNLPSETLKKFYLIRKPRDYFADAQTTPQLWPEKILCFTRKNVAELKAEALSRHHHHRYVLVIPWKGTGSVYVDDQQFKLKLPQTLIIFPFQFHHGFVPEQNHCLWLIITFETPHSSILEALRISPLREMEPNDLDLLSYLTDAWNSSKKSNELAYWLGLFLMRMLGSKSVSHPNKKLALKSSQPTSLLLSINKLCIPNLHLPLGIKEIADKLSISESHLRARFRDETGMSLGHHLRSLRLQKSISLLLQSELSISQIAERCGFDSVFTYSRSFKNYTGIRARDYRSRFAQNKT